MSQKRPTDRQGPGTKRSRTDLAGSLGDVVPVPGSIVKIELQNFMCHTYFEVELSSTVNFIVGRNGSGKSAILMALVIGLGGKSSATNRAPNMTEFIKQGSSWGQVTITLSNSNHNHDAWEYDTYGGNVVIERRITKKGSTYKLKSDSGKIISTKKNDLTLLLDYYNIQVNNPVSILNQEMSKTFLASTDPAAKYNFFMKSTHLEQMILDYQGVNERLQTIKHTIKHKEKSLPDVHAQVRQLQAQFKEVSELRDLNKKVSHFKDELIWSKVKEIEDEQIPIERGLEKLDLAIPRIEKKITDISVDYKNKEADVSAIEQDTNEEMRKFSSLESDQASLRQVANAKKRQYREVGRQREKKERAITSLDQDRVRITERMREIEETNNVRNIEAERAAREKELGEYKEKQAALRNEMTTTTSSMEEIERKLSGMSEEQSGIKEDIDQSDNQMRRNNDNIRRHQESKKNRLRLFGKFMPELLRRIEDAHNQGRFHQKPRGPFGLHIKVKEPAWANVIELAIGGLAQNFVVHDQHDRTQLQQLYRQCIDNAYEYPNMVMMKYRQDYYDVKNNRPQLQHPTIYDMCDISDNMISNALVEQGRIEQSLLIESAEEARRLIIGKKLRNTSNAWTKAGDDVRERGHYSNNLTRNKGYFTSDPSSLIADLQREVTELREQNSNHRSTHDRLTRQVAQIRAEYKTEKNRQAVIKRNLESVRSRIIELDNVEEAPLLDNETLEDEMKGIVAQIDEHRSEVETLRERETELQREAVEAEKKHEESIQRDSHITNRLEELKSSLHEEQGKLTKKLEILEIHKKKKKEIAAEKKNFNAELTAKKREIQDARGMAEQRCERISTRRGVKDLEQQIIKMEMKIRQGTRNTVSVDDITRRYHDAKTKFTEINDMVKDLNSFSRKLQKLLEDREEKYFLFRKEISKRINYFFIMNLSQRGYTGKLEINHDKRQLLMNLNVDTSGSSHDTHDVRSLSGGERSFSTVCFICSLWNLMESPFRCLDEFDVFMDLYNRRITMNLLMEHAFQHANQRQYILFTPQDMSSFSKKFKNIKILQLEAPQRNE